MRPQTINQRKALARAEKRVEQCQARYARTRSHAALVRLRDAVAAALRLSPGGRV
jgi:hypothetical protein